MLLANHLLDVILARIGRVIERGSNPFGEDDKVCSPRKSQKKVPAAGIDVLPYEALQHILSFLPSQEAVQTCVLARRWRHLWRSVCTLRLSELRLCRGLTEQEFSPLNSFVTNFLLRRERDATLDLCEFHINELDSSEVADWLSPQVGTLIQQALLYKAQTLRVELIKYSDCTYLVIQQHLTSQHLMMLELKCVWVTIEFLDLSSCPTLKKLFMNFCTIDAARISSQSLEQLTIMNCFSASDTDALTQIVAPNLVQLELTDNCMKAPLLENMPALTKGFVRLHGSHDICREMYGHSCSGNRCDKLHKYDDKSDGSTYSVLLKGLSEAESLELVAEPRTFIFERDLMWCPIFGNLKTLLLNEWCVENGFQAILCFLQLFSRSSFFNSAPRNWVGKKGRYNPSKQLLASKKLKLIEIKCKCFDERVQKIFCTFSSHCGFIERINVHQTERHSECCAKYDMK